MPDWLKEYDWKAIGASVLLLLAVILAIHATGFDVPPNQQEYGTPGADTAQQGAEQTIATYTIYLTWFTGLLALFTVILAGASIWQGYLTQQSIMLARDEFLA